MSNIDSLEERIVRIEKRNASVEVDKAWETSFIRRLLITGLTYIVIVLFFFTANLPKPFLNAIVPSVAFLLSTATVGVIKKWWAKGKY
jgi:hypothetical protein